jgi:folate-binding protein YgfZ
VLRLIGKSSDQVTGISVSETEHSFAAGEIEGVAVLVVRTDIGIDLLCPSEETGLPSAIQERGANSASEEAVEILRIESGRPRYGRDMTADNLPGELGLEERAVSFTKGCYVGQEPVARMHHRGHPNRHLRGIEPSQPASPGQVLVKDGKTVGTITSAAISPARGPIALALVRREVEPGQEIQVEGTAATVIELPFERGG